MEGRRPFTSPGSVLLLLLCWTLPLADGRTDQAGDGHKDASYPVTLVRRSVDRIKARWTSSAGHHAVSKRSTTTTTTKADDLLLHSVASYCTNFRSDPDIARYFRERADRQPLWSRDVRGSTRFTGRKPEGSAVRAQVFPVRVEAQRDQEDVWIVLHVAHSERALVAQVDAFRFQQTVLDMHEDACQTIVTQARFKVHAPVAACKDNSRRHLSERLRAIFQMSSFRDSLSSVVTTYVELCGFDKTWNSYEGKMKQTDSITSEDVQVPTFQFLSNTRDTVLIGKDRKVVIDLEVNISSEMEFAVGVVLWDWDVKTTTSRKARVGLDRVFYKNVGVSYDSPSDESSWFVVKVLNVTEDERVFRTQLRVVMSELTNSSGQLSFELYKATSGGTKITRGVHLLSKVNLKVEGEQEALPDDLVYFKGKQRFLCDGNGDKEESHPEFGANCTLHCQAFGRHISSIYISRRGSNPSPVVRSSSHVLPDQAVAMVDVGVASPDNQGAYQCTVVDDQGATASQGLQLFTSLFTEVRSFGLETSADQTTALLTCTAYGAEDMSLRISVSAQGKDQTRLDSDERFESNTTRGENHTTTLTLRVPWSELKIPRKSLTCLAKGQRGEKTQEIDLSFYPLNTQGVYPEFEHSLYDVELNQDDGTLNITCAAISKAPLEMNMAVDSLWRDTPLTEIYPDVVIAQETRGDTTTITAHRVPFKILRDHNEVQCVAAFGSIVATEKYRLIY